MSKKGVKFFLQCLLLIYTMSMSNKLIIYYIHVLTQHSLIVF